MDEGSLNDSTTPSNSSRSMQQQNQQKTTPSATQNPSGYHYSTTSTEPTSLQDNAAKRDGLQGRSR
jgi:hypothetical protein